MYKHARRAGLDALGSYRMPLPSPCCVSSIPTSLPFHTSLPPSLPPSLIPAKHTSLVMSKLEFFELYDCPAQGWLLLAGTDQRRVRVRPHYLPLPQSLLRPPHIVSPRPPSLPPSLPLSSHPPAIVPRPASGQAPSGGFPHALGAGGDGGKENRKREGRREEEDWGELCV